MLKWIVKHESHKHWKNKVKAPDSVSALEEARRKFGRSVYVINMEVEYQPPDCAPFGEALYYENPSDLPPIQRKSGNAALLLALASTFIGSNTSRR